MPELPEVETVVRGLEAAIAGRRIARAELRRKDLRFPFPPRFAQRLTGRRILGFTRRAKYILAGLDDGGTLIIHLGMSGRVTLLRAAAAAASLGEFHSEQPAADGNGPHDHVLLGLDDGTRLVYTDPRRFGMMDLAGPEGLARHRLLKGIGEEPLGNGFHAQFLAEKFTGKAAPLKAALLDQRLIAGLGNIYVCEALHRARLSPLRQAGTLAASAARLEELAQHIRAVLNEAILAGGSTLRDFAQADGGEGRFQQVFRAYGRDGQPCVTPGCAGTIRRIVQSGRSTFYCGSCQT